MFITPEGQAHKSVLEGTETAWWLHTCAFTHPLPSSGLGTPGFPLCPPPMEDCALLHLKSVLFRMSRLWSEGQRRKQEKWRQFGLPGPRDLGIFKGFLRMSSFSGTTLPIWPPPCPPIFIFQVFGMRLTG